MVRQLAVRRQAVVAGRLVLLGTIVLAGCAEVPPLETPPEFEEKRAELEAEAGAESASPDRETGGGAAAPEEAAREPVDDDYTIDVPPPYPVASPSGAAPLEGSAGEAAGRDDATVVRIDSPGRKASPRTLWEASVEAKKKRNTAPVARIAITDENLHEFQDGDVTIGGATARPEPAEATPAEEQDTGAAALDEQYWRSTVLDLRTRLRAAVDEMAELEERAADLRRSFYAQDDPYVRDGEIKPAWDRTLDRVQEIRGEILALSRQLDETLEEGRRAGALPGWLREGAALEPEADELPRDLREEAPRAHQPVEPSVIEIEEQEPPD